MPQNNREKVPKMRSPSPSRPRHNRSSPTKMRNGESSSVGHNGVNNSNGNSSVSGVDRQTKCPFLLRVFCSTSRHNPLADYNRGKVPANELQIYTWRDASLRELTSLIKEVNVDARRRGTYFDFALVFPSPRPTAANHYTSRDIGTTVSGQKGPDDTKTLGQTSFTVGDYLDVAITPPIGRGDRFGGGGDRFGGRGGPQRRGRDDMGGRRGEDRMGGGGGGRFRPY